jgi:hypothetical protein
MPDLNLPDFGDIGGKLHKAFPGRDRRDIGPQTDVAPARLFGTFRLINVGKLYTAPLPISRRPVQATELKAINPPLTSMAQAMHR